MSLAPNLTLITEVMPIIRRDFPLASTALLNPNNANPLVDGEWLELNTSYQLARASGEQTKLAWQVFAERGRYDTQAIGKAPILYIGGYEAETTIYDSTGLAVNDPLMVTDVTIGGLTKRGLKKATGTGQHLVFAYVTRLPTGKVRYYKLPSPVWYTI